MAEFVGKSGVDAIFRALQAICRVIKKYNLKAQAAITVAAAAELITPAQEGAALAFLASAQATCDIFQIVASNSGF